MSETEIKDDPPNVEYGDLDLARANEILRTVVGSGVHGIAIEGTDDNDEMGIFVEPVDNILGIAGNMDVVTYRTKPEGVRSGPGDTDLSMYSLRKYIRLVTKGNPTAMLPLWCLSEAVLSINAIGEELRDHREAFLSQQAVERFLGYMYDQHEAMMGRSRPGKLPSRPELVEKYGWDVKYGSHALRLAYQGHEICTTGMLSLPLRNPERAHVLAVKRGEIPRQEVSRSIVGLTEATVKMLKKGTPLPPEPDWVRINAFSIDAHLEHWRSMP